MATYNGEKYLRQQIDSILYQLDNDDELIISDDGSDDSTLNIIHSYNDKRIVLLNHKTDLEFKKDKYSNLRLITNNFENALKSAHGDYIFLSDQDDIWLEGKLNVCLEYLNNYDIILCNFNIINNNNEIVYEKNYNNIPVSKYIIFNILNMRFKGCCMAFNKRILNYILPFPKYLLLHDAWIGCIGNRLGRFCFIEKVLHSYRRHENNISYMKKSKYSIFFRIHYRIIIYMQVLRRIYFIKWKNIPIGIIN
jgi:glycosyltransferase involved in cell wall biosynthesis